MKTIKMDSSPRKIKVDTFDRLLQVLRHETKGPLLAQQMDFSLHNISSMQIKGLPKKGPAIHFEHLLNAPKSHIHNRHQYELEKTVEIQRTLVHKAELLDVLGYAMELIEPYLKFFPRGNYVVLDFISMGLPDSRTALNGFAVGGCEEMIACFLKAPVRELRDRWDNFIAGLPEDSLKVIESLLLREKEDDLRDLHKEYERQLQSLQRNFRARISDVRTALENHQLKRDTEAGASYTFSLFPRGLGHGKKYSTPSKALAAYRKISTNVSGNQDDRLYRVIGKEYTPLGLMSALLD